MGATEAYVVPKRNSSTKGPGAVKSLRCAPRGPSHSPAFTATALNDRGDPGRTVKSDIGGRPDKGGFTYISTVVVAPSSAIRTTRKPFVLYGIALSPTPFPS